MKPSLNEAHLSPADAASEQPNIPHESYARLFLRFLRFGSLAWGGPVAQIAMIRQELVEEERWISRPRFNRLLGIYQVLPGPEAHELCVYFGMLARGRLGGVLAGLGFMLPGFVLMFALSWLYVTFDLSTSGLEAVFHAIQPAVIALIVRAVHRIGEHALHGRWLWGIAIIAATVDLLGAPFWMSLPVAGLGYVLFTRQLRVLAVVLAIVLVVATLLFSAGRAGVDAQGAPGPSQAASFSRPAEPGQESLPALFWSGLRAGLLTFGGAYTVIPFLEQDAVERGAWMTRSQFLDGLALSGILPAPLIIFSTFVGYLGGGALGALVLTFGIFLPAFGFSLLFHDALERLTGSKPFRAFLDGVTAGVVGIIASTTLGLGRSAIVDVPTALIFAAALSVLYLWKSKAAVPLVVLGSGLLGWIFWS